MLDAARKMNTEGYRVHHATGWVQEGALCGNPMQRIGEHIYQALKVPRTHTNLVHVLKL